MDNKIIRIGSRESVLAIRQAEIVKQKIESAMQNLHVEIITMKTMGDKILDKSLELIGGKGLFVKELDRALAEDKIDISVHSLKDMPMMVSEELPLLAFTEREDPRDVLIYKAGHKSVPDNGVIGTSSRRRMLQLKRMFPGCSFEGIRGNIQTRMKKLETGQYDATMLAAAGVKRLQMEGCIGRYFSTEELIPAAGQGILAVQGRKGEWECLKEILNDSTSETAAKAERKFVEVLDGGCTSPIAAFAEVKGNEFLLRGLYYRESDEAWFVDEMAGDRENAEAAGEALALQMRRKYGE